MIARFLSICAAGLLLPFTATPAAAQVSLTADHGMEISPAPPAPAAPEEMEIAPAPERNFSFAGVNMAQQQAELAQTAWPPTPSIAVGPSHVVEVMNQSVAIYTRAGKRLSHGRLRDFLSHQVGDFVHRASFDPKVVYDRDSGRFFMAGACNSPSITKGEPVMLAVSTSSDPTKPWKKYILDVGIPKAGTTYYFSSNMNLGIDGNGVYLGLRIVPSGGVSGVPETPYCKIIATRKSTLVADNPKLSTVHHFSNLTGISGSPIPAISLDDTAAGDAAWFAATVTNARANVRLWKVTWSGTTARLSAATTVNTPAYGATLPVLQRGSTLSFSPPDDYLLSAVLSKGHLWTCRTVGTNALGTATPVNRNGCEWIDISVSGASPVLTQSGRVYDTSSSAPRSYFVPAIGVNPSGHALLSFLGGGINEYLGTWFTGREKGDPAGAMGPVQLLKEGEAIYEKAVGGGLVPVGRTGAVCLDPVDAFSLWTVQSYAFSDPTSTDGAWGTWIACVGFSDTPGAIGVSASSLAFKKVELKKTKTLSFTITSKGNDSLKCTIKAPGAPYTITSGGGTFTLAPGKSRTVKVRFKPTAIKKKTASLKITTNDLTKKTVTIKLTGSGK